jgi:hypothetical protein
LRWAGADLVTGDLKFFKDAPDEWKRVTRGYTSSGRPMLIFVREDGKLRAKISSLVTEYPRDRSLAQIPECLAPGVCESLYALAPVCRHGIFDAWGHWREDERSGAMFFIASRVCLECRHLARPDLRLVRVSPKRRKKVYKLGLKGKCKTWPSHAYGCALCAFWMETRASYTRAHLDHTDSALRAMLTGAVTWVRVRNLSGWEAMVAANVSGWDFISETEMSNWKIMIPGVHVWEDGKLRVKVSPRDKIKGPTIQKCPHGWHIPKSGFIYCTICRDEQDHRAVKANPSWTCTYGALPRVDAALSDEKALSYLKANRVPDMGSPRMESFGDHRVLENILHRLPVHLQDKARAEMLRRDLVRAQRAFACIHGRTTNFRTAWLPESELLAMPVAKPLSTDRLLKIWEDKLLAAESGPIEPVKEPFPNPGLKTVDPPEISKEEVAKQKVTAGLDDDDGWKTESVQAGAAGRNYEKQRTAHLRSLRERVSFEEAGSFQIHSTYHPERRKDAPAWILSDERLKEYADFLTTDNKRKFERKKLARTIAILVWYYRANLTCPEIAALLNKPESTEPEDHWTPEKVEKVRDRRKKVGDAFFSAKSISYQKHLGGSQTSSGERKST